MDYEKKYKEALERMKSWARGEHPECFSEAQKAAEFIFPEFKESEDEKIRKALIDELKIENANYKLFNDIPKERFISWLEKQGASIDVDSILNKVGIKDAYKDGDAWCILYGDNIQDGVCGFGYTKEEALIEFLKELLAKQGEQKSIWHNEAEEPQRGSLILLIMQSGKPIVAKMIEPNHTFNHGERWAYIDDLLDKQGELPEGCVRKQVAEAKEALYTAEVATGDGSIKTVVSKKVSFPNLQSKEWSEEDEKMYRMCVDAVEYYHTPEDESVVRDWLQSLKDRLKGE